MASLPYNLVKAEQFVDRRLTTMLNYRPTDKSIKYPAHTLDKRTVFGKKAWSVWQQSWASLASSPLTLWTLSDLIRWNYRT